MDDVEINSYLIRVLVFTFLGVLSLAGYVWHTKIKSDNKRAEKQDETNERLTAANEKLTIIVTRLDVIVEHHSDDLKLLKEKV